MTMKAGVLWRLANSQRGMPRKQIPIRHIVIGNPDNRRVLFFQQALGRFRLEPATVVPYLDLLKGTCRLHETIELLASKRNGNGGLMCLRIESPGEDFDVERRLISRGAGLLDPKFKPAEISKHAALRLQRDHGRIAFPAQWFAGYSSLLAEVSASMERFPQVTTYNHVEDILAMFNKPKCYRRLESAGIPLPRALFDVESFDDLLERMRALQWNRVFVKLANGSSASGVIALYMHRKTMRAVTAMEMVGSGARTKFYNNLKLRVYHQPHAIRRAVDFLCRETAHVEQWLPKAHQMGRNFDLRVVAIAGDPSHIVIRTSLSPITNLHLGNRRGDRELLKRVMGPKKWQSLLDMARQAANAFPDTLCVGLDVLLKPGFRNPTILEANAFGDLLPGVTHKRLNTYETSIKTLVARFDRGLSKP
jgi:hypothetical protein